MKSRAKDTTYFLTSVEFEIKCFLEIPLNRHAFASAVFALILELRRKKGLLRKLSCLDLDLKSHCRNSAFFVFILLGIASVLLSSIGLLLKGWLGWPF